MDIVRESLTYKRERLTGLLDLPGCGTGKIVLSTSLGRHRTFAVWEARWTKLRFARMNKILRAAQETYSPLQWERAMTWLRHPARMEPKDRRAFAAKHCGTAACR